MLKVIRNPSQSINPSRCWALCSSRLNVTSKWAVIFWCAVILRCFLGSSYLLLRCANVLCCVHVRMCICCQYIVVGEDRFVHIWEAAGSMPFLCTITLHSTSGFPLSVSQTRSLVATASTIHTAVKVLLHLRHQMICNAPLIITSATLQSTRAVFSPHCCEAWTLTLAGWKNLDVFHVPSSVVLYARLKMVGVHLQQWRSGCIQPRFPWLAVRRHGLLPFGHSAHMSDTIPAKADLSTVAGVHDGRRPSTYWKRPRGRPPTTWLHKLTMLHVIRM